ncbi:MAG: hypothetical protein GY941_19315, partial [Planctomycetes bacterium]|nr:hypothetical protein [Planctomycetota bacterium]
RTSFFAARVGLAGQPEHTLSVLRLRVLHNVAMLETRAARLRLPAVAWEALDFRAACDALAGTRTLYERFGSCLVRAQRDLLEAQIRRAAEPEPAARAYRAAVAGLSEAGRELEAAEALFELAELLHAAGREAAVSELLTELAGRCADHDEVGERFSRLPGELASTSPLPGAEAA